MTAVGADLDFDDAIFGAESESIDIPLDREQANRILGRRARVERERDRDEAVAKDSVEHIVGWLGRVRERHDKELARLDELLNHFHAAVLALDSRAKTIDLPYGLLKARVGTQPTFEWVNDEELLGWCQVHHPELVGDRTTYSVNKTEAKAAFTPVLRDGVMCVEDANGELVPGVVVHPPSTTYSIDTSERGQ